MLGISGSRICAFVRDHRAARVALLFGLMALPQLATPAAAQTGAAEKGMINEWLILPSDSDSSCLASSTAGETTLAFALQQAGKPPLVMMTNPGWKLAAGQRYGGTLSLDAQETEAAITFVNAELPDPTLGGRMPAEVPEKFRKSDMLYVTVEELGIRDTYNITDGAKIWSALEACVKAKAGK